MAELNDKRMSVREFRIEGWRGTGRTTLLMEKMVELSGDYERGEVVLIGTHKPWARDVWQQMKAHGFDMLVCTMEEVPRLRGRVLSVVGFDDWDDQGDMPLRLDPQDIEYQVLLGMRFGGVILKSMIGVGGDPATCTEVTLDGEAEA